MRILAALACVLATVTAAAQTSHGQDWQSSSDGGFPVDTYYIASPDQLIRQGIDRLTGFLMGSDNPEPETVRRFVAAEIGPHFDFAYMARWAAGPLYRRLDPAQRAAMTDKLRGMFLDAFARHLGTLQRPLPHVDVFPARPGRTIREAVVYARVISGPAPPVRLEFRFYWSGQGWKVYDAVANGASAVAFYRQYFTRALRRHGPEVVLR